jgi:hypothetical protein
MSEEGACVIMDRSEYREVDGLVRYDLKQRREESLTATMSRSFDLRFGHSHNSKLSSHISEMLMPLADKLCDGVVTTTLRYGCTVFWNIYCPLVDALSLVDVLNAPSQKPSPEGNHSKYESLCTLPAALRCITVPAKRLPVLKISKTLSTSIAGAL